ncbi:histidine phosphatase superfamily [Mycena olivaceomarginata]|nr:histidine phosphatase superfamily [Mycena olivaceomarginata]
MHHGKPELWVTVVFARHADRIENFSSPTTWATFNTFITPLGTEQAFQSGTYLRSEYLDSRSRSFIAGLYPPTRDYKITLANGSTIVGALDGFQYIPIESVEMNEDVSLNGSPSRPNFDLHVANLEQSTLFLAKVKEAAPFLRKLHHYLGARPIDFSFMVRAKFEPPHSHVRLHRRHNSTFLQIPPGFVNQARLTDRPARVLADFYDGNTFSDPKPDGIGNVATRVMLPSIFSALTRIANSTDPLKLAINSITAKANPEIAGIHYNSLAALELHNFSTGGEPTLWLKFKNGTDEHAFRTLTIFGKTDDPLSEFIARLTVC